MQAIPSKENPPYGKAKTPHGHERGFELGSGSISPVPTFRSMRRCVTASSIKPDVAPCRSTSGVVERPSRTRTVGRSLQPAANVGTTTVYSSFALKELALVGYEG